MISVTLVTTLFGDTWGEAKNACMHRLTQAFAALGMKTAVSRGGAIYTLIANQLWAKMRKRAQA